MWYIVIIVCNKNYSDAIVVGLTGHVIVHKNMNIEQWY